MDGVFVFSYNRGRFLENCVISIEACLPAAPITIIDDRSTDPNTGEVLRTLAKRYEVVHSNPQGLTEHKTGGLSGGMNLAMSLAKARGHEHVLFLQDDMQLVRPVLPRDLDAIVSYFDAIPNTIQLSSNFGRALSAPDFFDKFDVHTEASCYLRRLGMESGKSGFSDTGVFSVSRYSQLFGSFVLGELGNSQKAIQRGLRCGRSLYPFSSWLPYPTSFRGKHRSIQHRMFEYLGRSGYYPIDLMSDKSVDRLFARDPRADCAQMEEYLHSPGCPRADIWSTGGGEYNFLAYGSPPARLYAMLRAAKQTATKKSTRYASGS